MRVYIAGPYTKGDVALNVRNAIKAGSRVADAGHDPFIPHLTHFWHLLYPRLYGEWLALDMVWLEQCECVIRLPGDSLGADKECQRALELGIPVHHSVYEFLEVVKGMGV